MRRVDIESTSLFSFYVIRLDFLVVDSVPYDLIIGAATLVGILASIDVYHKTVSIRNHAKTEALNLAYEPETCNGSEYELTTESESDSGEDLNK